MKESRKSTRRLRPAPGHSADATQAMPTSQQTALTSDVLGRHGIADVVAPGAVDVQVPGVVGLLAKAELLDDPAAGLVLGADVHLDAVQAAFGEGVVDDEGQRGRDDPAPGHP